MRLFEISLVPDDDLLIRRIYCCGDNYEDCLRRLMVELPNLRLQMIDSFVDVTPDVESNLPY